MTKKEKLQKQCSDMELSADGTIAELEARIEEATVEPSGESGGKFPETPPAPAEPTTTIAAPRGGVKEGETLQKLKKEVSKALLTISKKKEELVSDGFPADQIPRVTGHLRMGLQILNGDR